MLNRRHRERRATNRMLTDNELVEVIVNAGKELHDRMLAKAKTRHLSATGPGQHSGLTNGIMAVLSRHPEGVTMDELRNELTGLGLRSSNVDVQLVRLQKRGLIETRGIPRKTKYLLYQPTQGEPHGTR